LKILHFDTDDIENPLGGGQPVRTFEIERRLAERHDITVFTSVYPGCKRREVRGRLLYRRIGFRVAPFGLSPHLTFLSAIGPVIRSTPHDLVVEEFTPPVGFCMVPWWTRRPVVLIVQWFFFEQWERRYHLPFSKWMHRIAHRAGHYRHVIVQTKAMQRIFQTLLPQADCRVIPCGVNDDAFSDNNPGEGDFVVYLGRLDMVQKGLDILLAAWKNVCGPKNIPLVIAGEGPNRRVLEQRVARAGLGKCVRFVGRVGNSRKRDLLGKARLMVLPSRDETFGMVALESMAAGKPVVAFDIDHLNELVRPPWGVLAPPFDADRLGRAIADLWESPRACREAGEAARQEADRYRWDRLAREQEQFYAEIVEGRSP